MRFVDERVESNVVHHNSQGLIILVEALA